MYLSVIIPAYNEEDRLPATLEKAIKYFRKQSYSSEILIVSDGSTDNTKKVVESFESSFSELRVLEYKPNKGKGAAVKLGMLESKGDIRLFMDADFAVPIECLERLIEKYNASC